MLGTLASRWTKEILGEIEKSKRPAVTANQTHIENCEGWWLSYFSGSKSL